jgi:hypothetical protein
MTRNQKIALGCGGAGCLGLIVVVVAGVLIYFFAYNRTSYSTNRNDDDNFNVTTNRNSNSNDNLATNDNDNDNSSSSSSSSSASSLSNDDKHKLYVAASMTGDAELLRRVSVKLGLMSDDYTPGPEYSSFLAEHITWRIRNSDFVQSLDTPEKARAYVDENFPN